MHLAEESLERNEEALLEIGSRLIILLNNIPRTVHNVVNINQLVQILLDPRRKLQVLRLKPSRILQSLFRHVDTQNRHDFLN